MKRTIAIIMLAGASTVAHAQWTNEVQSNWVNPPAPLAIPQGAIDVQTGQYLAPAAGGVVNPQTGAYYQQVGGGYINTQNGQFTPAH
jgi:hypothetical protein